MITLPTNTNSSKKALIDAESNQYVTFGDLSALSESLKLEVPPESLVVLRSNNDLRTIQTYVALQLAGYATLLADGNRGNTDLHQLATHFGAAAVFSTNESDELDPTDFVPVVNVDGLSVTNTDWTQVHPDLAALISTSGSTGSAKYVRLSKTNIASNASAIAKSLDLSESDRAITTLPLAYSFGMSIINSHLTVGASIAITNRSVLEREFWQQAKEKQVTSLSGVPSLYKTLSRLNLDTMAPESLNTLTQAGGKLDPESIEKFANLMRDRDGHMYIMYGQTEASPRIACFDAVAHPDKIGSVGAVLDGGSIEIAAPVGSDKGEIVYSGPNVMMGYAVAADDLTHPDTFGDSLHTGDIGFQDEDGFTYITGRISRFVKLAGVRTSLDEVETLATNLENVTAISPADDSVVLITSTEDQGILREEAKRIARELKMPPKTIRVVFLDPIPLLDSGKPDYQRIIKTLELED